MSSCTLQGCHSQGTPQYQNFCSLPHLKQFANRQVNPKFTNVHGQSRVYFYDKKKHGKNYEFSNFFPKSVHYHGSTFKTAEHAFQAEKFHYKPSQNQPLAAKVQKIYNQILNADTPKQAVAIAHKNEKYVDRNWHKKQASGYTKKEEVMFGIVKDKFTRHQNLRTKLLNTGKARLIEDAAKDPFWGQGANHQGENKLGRILQKIRKDMRNGKY